MRKSQCAISLKAVSKSDHRSRVREQDKAQRAKKQGFLERKKLNRQLSNSKNLAALCGTARKIGDIKVGENLHKMGRMKQFSKQDAMPGQQTEQRKKPPPSV